jgi:serine/threonine protein kinase
MRDFGKEVSVMAELHHPNVVMLMGFCAKPPVLVMEYMGRGSLFRVLHATDIRLHPTMLLHVLVDVACGMSYVRSPGFAPRASRPGLRLPARSRVLSRSSSIFYSRLTPQHSFSFHPPPTSPLVCQ